MQVVVAVNEINLDHLLAAARLRAMSAANAAKIEARRFAENNGMWASAYGPHSPHRKNRSRLVTTSSTASIPTAHVLINDFLQPNPATLTVQLLRECAASFLLVFGHLLASRTRHGSTAGIIYALTHFVLCEVWFGTSGNPYIALVTQLIFTHRAPVYYSACRWVAQFAGASLAGYFASTLLPSLQPAVITCASGTTGLQIVLAEVLACTVYAYIHTVLYRVSETNEPAPLAVAGTSPALVLSAWVLLSILMLSDTTGVSLNLWRSLIPSMFANDYTSLPYYVAGSFIGTMTGASIGGYFIDLAESTGQSNDDATD